MQDARVRAALLAICLLCLIGSGAVLYSSHRQDQTPPVVITPAPPEKTADVSAPPAAPAARIYVDVAGAVRRPALYALPPGSRIMQAIVAAGGPASGADLDSVNLAQKLADGEKVFVPKHTAALPASDRPVPLTALVATELHPASKIAKTLLSGHSNKLTAESGLQIALNTATIDDLQKLPTVGPAMAARILAYRAQSGGFGKLDDLMQVPGIGPKKFAKIAPCVKLN
jgi:competence protein ComEA